MTTPTLAQAIAKLKTQEEHRLIHGGECSFGNSGYAYNEGYDHYYCSCGKCLGAFRNDSDALLKLNEHVKALNDKLMRALVEALSVATSRIESQPHHVRCHLLKDRPFSEKARLEFDTKGCDCWKAQTLAEISEKIAGVTK